MDIVHDQENHHPQIATLAQGEVGVGKLVERISLTKPAISHQWRGSGYNRLIRILNQGRNVCTEDDLVIDHFMRGLDHGIAWIAG